MKKWILAAVAALTGACSAPELKAPAFPESIAPGWTRGEVKPLDASGFPEIVKGIGLTHGWRTEYRSAGGAIATVDAYGLKSSTQGLDLVQRWKPQRDQAQFYTEHYLLNVSWTGAQREELSQLVRLLPKLVEAK